MPDQRDPRIDAYIARAAEFARPILQHLRTLVHTACPEAVETVKWRAPFFEYRGKPLCATLAFKAHCAFVFWHRGMKDVLGRDGAKADEAMGNLGRITRLADLPADKAMIRYVREAMKLTESGTPSRPPKTKKAEPKVPTDLAAALKTNKVATITFKNFSPSHRREYIEWIEEAKRPETRAKRLATTLEWLTAGKGRNWQYERGC